MTIYEVLCHCFNQEHVGNKSITSYDAKIIRSLSWYPPEELRHWSRLIGRAATMIEEDKATMDRLERLVDGGGS